MANTTITCGHCGKLADKPTGAVNRAVASGLRIFCDRVCAGLGRQKHKSVEQKKAEKKAYDAAHRLAIADELKASKAEYHKRTYDPAKAAEHRKKRMPRHVEYCRNPRYRAWKKTYDRQYRAKKFFGDFAECFLLVMDIRGECLSRMTDYDIRQEKGTTSKSQKRKRDYERSVSNHPEEGPLGNLKRGEGRQNGGLASGLHRLPGSGNPSHHEHAASGVAAGKAARSG